MPAKNKRILLTCVGLTFWGAVVWLFWARPLFIIEILPDLLPLSVFTFLLFAAGLLILCAVTASVLRSTAPHQVWKVIFLSALVLVLYNLSPLAPAWQCFSNSLYVRYANAAGQNCDTICTNNKKKPCSGWSSCWNKNISCSAAGKDQDGRGCNGCCFSCKVVCEDPDPEPPSAQAPSISGTVACSETGDNGWCTGISTLNLSASDPQNYALTISGSINGTAFTCATGGTCTISLPEGNGSITYKATAANSGLSSSTGTRTWKRDVTPPTANAVHAPATGSNGWHVIAPLAVSAGGSDALSGLASAEIAVNGGAWQSSASLSDGIYTIDFLAVDNAGNSATFSKTIQVDATPPSINPIVSSPDGQAGWFVSAPVDVSVTGSDAGSGLATTLVSLDGTTWQSDLVLGDGIHTVQFRSVDNAGNTTSTTRTIKVDASVPEILIDISGTEGKSGWYVSPTTTTVAANEISGIDHIEFNQNGSGWETGTSIDSAEGINTIEIKVYDVAGNIAAKTVVIKIDTIPPTITTTTTGTAGLGDWYITQATTRVSAKDDTSGVDFIEHKQNAGDWEIGSTIVSQDGSNNIAIRVYDEAGNMAEDVLEVKVDTTPPTVTPIIPKPDGLNNWFVTAPVKISVEGSDSESGLASVGLSTDELTWMPDALLSDGTHEITFKATDNAGNSTAVTRTAKIDTVAPTLSTVIAGIAGKLGWYVSQTNTTISASDDTSGVATIQYNQNKLGWEIGTSFFSKDGINSIVFEAYDVAGNRASGTLEIKVDTEKPNSKFTSPTNGTKDTLVRGSYPLSGVSADTISGLSTAEISLDGKNWLPLPMAGDNSWTYNWDTSTWFDGIYPVTVRATDIAGNTEVAGSRAQVTLVVNNTPPHIKLTPEWFIWQSGSLTIKTEYFPVKAGQIVIADPEGRWKKIEIPFGEKYPSQIRWDRQFANGVLAPSGNYYVSVSACNIHDLCAEKSAVIKIPWYTVTLPTSPAPTQLVEVEREEPVQQNGSSTPVIPIFELPAADEGLPVELHTVSISSLVLLSVLVIVALMWAISSSALADKRPQAIRAIAQTLHMQHYKGE